MIIEPKPLRSFAAYCRRVFTVYSIGHSHLTAPPHERLKMPPFLPDVSSLASFFARPHLTFTGAPPLRLLAGPPVSGPPVAVAVAGPATGGTAVAVLQALSGSGGVSGGLGRQMSCPETGFLGWDGPLMRVYQFTMIYPHTDYIVNS